MGVWNKESRVFESEHPMLGRIVKVTEDRSYCREEDPPATITLVFDNGRELFLQPVGQETEGIWIQ